MIKLHRVNGIWEVTHNGETTKLDSLGAAIGLIAKIRGVSVHNPSISLDKAETVE